jgi:uncharacterized protein YPO0396
VLHTARFDPEGTLVTGDNVAGKTAPDPWADDGLLLPSGRVAFNVVRTGDRTDRTLLCVVVSVRARWISHARARQAWLASSEVVAGALSNDDGS